MPDTQIHPTGSVSAPADYTVPSAAELLLKMAFARFDGTLAAGSFKPCLRIISDAGTVAGEAVADDAVAAGASADVTWFPRVGGGGSPSVTTSEWFYVNRNAILTMGAGVADTIPWSELVSSDSSLFSLATQNHADDAVQVSRLGTLVVSSYLIPDPAGTDFIVGIHNNLVGWGVMGENTEFPDKLWNRAGLPGGVARFGPRDISLMMMSQTPQNVVANFHNYDAANRNLQSAQLAGIWWPDAVAIS